MDLKENAERKEIPPIAPKKPVNNRRTQRKWLLEAAFVFLLVFCLSSVFTFYLLNVFFPEASSFKQLKGQMDRNIQGIKPDYLTPEYLQKQSRNSVNKADSNTKKTEAESDHIPFVVLLRELGFYTVTATKTLAANLYLVLSWLVVFLADLSRNVLSFSIFVAENVFHMSRAAFGFIFYYVRVSGVWILKTGGIATIIVLQWSFYILQQTILFMFGAATAVLQVAASLLNA